MISPPDFIEALKSKKFFSFTGIPCSFFQAAINYVLDAKDLNYTIVPNEGSALALASGAYLAGRPTALFIQNSGFGNLVNPLTSLNMIYRIPVLIFMSGRAYGVKDEPQHEIMGKTMGPILDAMGISHADMPQEIEAFREALQEACEHMRTSNEPYIFFVRKDTIDDYTPEKRHAPRYPLKRIDAIRILGGSLHAEDIVIATTGKPSRELFAVLDRPQNFYMQGSMGHAAAIGLGAAMARTDKKVIVLDGDGAILMHLGILSSIGHYRPANLIHIVLDNEAYETTGDQDTTSSTTDLEMIARAAGYREVLTATDERSLRDVLATTANKAGPIFIRIKIDRSPTPAIPRISSKYDATQITRRFQGELSR